MPTVNILEAKTQLSRLVERVESGAETEIIIARNGRPAVRLVPLATRPTQRRIGIAVGQFKVPESIDLSNGEVEHLFAGDPNP
jgi:prevent-host-death family protein